MNQEAEVRIARTPEEHKAAYLVREEVFIREQGVPEHLERDGRDDESTHFLVYLDTRVVGTGRYRETAPRVAKFERMAVLTEYRNRGVGKDLLRAMLNHVSQNGFSRVTLHAQVDALTFYQRAGFVQTGEEFMEAGIRHVPMERSLN